MLKHNDVRFDAGGSSSCPADGRTAAVQGFSFDLAKLELSV
jgi:hypothetical protein